jgi:hypothetical protein
MDAYCKSILHLFDGVDLLEYDWLKRSLFERGILYTPEEKIGMEAKKLIGTFEVHEVLPSKYLNMSSEIDSLFENLGNWSGLSGKDYVLHRIDTNNYLPHLPVMKGILGLSDRSELVLEDMPPSAELIRGTKRVVNGERLNFGRDIFPTKPENSRFRSKP